LNKTSPLGGKTELTPIFFYEALFVPQTDTDYDAESIGSIRAWGNAGVRFAPASPPVRIANLPFGRWLLQGFAGFFSRIVVVGSDIADP